MNLEQITAAEANGMLEGGGHYLGSALYQARFCLTTPGRDALAVYSHPIAAHFKLMLESPLELARLWRADAIDFQLTEFLGASLRWLRKVAPETDCVFSYADPAARNGKTGKPHSGTVYRAANFAFAGKSRVTDRWQRPDGVLVNAAQVYRLLKTKSRDRIAEMRPDWELIEGVPKLLYVYPMRLPVTEVLSRLGEKLPDARRALFSKSGGFRVRVYQDKFPSLQCANCRRQFLARRADAKTCSPKCRVSLHRKRVKSESA